MPSGSQDLTHRRDDVAAHRLEAGGEELHDDPAVVPIHDQRGERVAFSVHHAVGGGVDAGAPGQAGSEPLHATRRRRPAAFGGLEQAERRSPTRVSRAPGRGTCRGGRAPATSPRLPRGWSIVSER